MSAFTLVSETHSTESTIGPLYDFMIDFKNFKSILPEDKVEDFKATDQHCSFTIKGVTPMKIKRVDAMEPQYIVFETEGLAKFNFRLKVKFFGFRNEKGKCYIEMMGDLNPFIKTMVEKQLGSLVNTMALKLSKLKLDQA